MGVLIYYFEIFFAEKCIKMKEFGAGGGGRVNEQLSTIFGSPVDVLLDSRQPLQKSREVWTFTTIKTQGIVTNKTIEKCSVGRIHFPIDLPYKT